MKVSDLRKELAKLPTDAEVTFRTYIGFDEIALVCTLGTTVWLLYIKPE